MSSVPLGLLLALGSFATALAKPPGVSAEREAVVVAAPGGAMTRWTPLDARLREARGGGRPIAAVTPRLDASGRVVTHDGIAEAWGAGTHDVAVDARLLADCGVGDTLVLEWDVQAAGGPVSRVRTEAPLSSWLDAGAPDPWILRLGLAGSRRPAALADCPPDGVLECDGFGNVVDRQAWLDLFRGTADPGCGAIARTIRTTPGVLQPVLTFLDFADLAAWTLNGRAATLGNPVIDDLGRSVLRLTSSFTESGSAFVTRPVSLAADSSFRASFTFRITLPGGSSDPDGLGADGLAFVIQSVANTAGGAGGGIGYQGITQSVAVEMDTWDNGGWDDFDGNHVGIDIDGNIDSVAQARVARRMNDGDLWSAWIDYDGAADRLEVRVDPTGVRPALPAVTAAVDVPALLRGTDAYVGFTSGTGAAFGAHDILSFVFETYAPVTCPSRAVESVVVTFVDECGNGVSCERLLWTSDTSPPKLVPADPRVSCGGALFVDGGPGGSAFASPAVIATEACGTATVTNDRTAGGSDASDVYPCGATTVRFDAVDDCGNASTCSIVVSVQPPAPPEGVGPALRVTKSAAGEPVLDWSRTALPPGATFAVLACDGSPLPRRSAWPLAARTWLDAGVTPSVRWYDVRSMDCSGGLSRD